jgi:uncharacterized protein (TIGR02679 family)
MEHPPSPVDDGAVEQRPSLVDPAMAPVWAAVRQRLERQGVDNRGRVRLPDLEPSARLSLHSLLGRPVGKTLDLGALEAALQALDVGVDLPAALAALRHPVSAEPERRRAASAASRAARKAAREATAAWPEEWAPVWIDDVVCSGALRGMNRDEAVGLVAAVRKILDHLDGFLDGVVPGSAGRVDLAARLFGSSHALDAGTRLEAAATRALRHRLGDLDRRALWARAGAHLDLTSAPALSWRLPLAPGSTLGAVVAASTTAGLPYHVTQLAVTEHPVVLRPGSDILVVENPRLVEAAAQRRIPQPVIATNGNPSGAVLTLLTQLLGAGAVLHYHGDFDTAGLAICARLHDLGLVPWHMDAADYLAAVAEATAAGIALPEDQRPVPETPWDPALRMAFTQRRLVVHEERLLHEVLAPPTVERWGQPRTQTPGQTRTTAG